MRLSTKVIFLQRLMSMIMSLAMIVSMVCIVSVPISAATIDLDTFNTKLTEFKNTRYAHNSVYIDNPGLTGGYECFGFANELALFIFGSYPTHVGNGTQARSGWTVTYGDSAVDNLSVGDVVRRRSNGSNSTSDHSIFITEINGDTIYYCDANSDYRNTVKYNQSTTKSALKTAISRSLAGDSSKTGWVAHHKDNNTSGGTTSIFFDLNTFNLRFSEFQTNRYANGSTYVDNPDLTGGYCGFGFANELSIYMFGTYPTYHSSAPAHTVTEGWTIAYGSSAIDNLMIADTARFVHDNGEWDHTIFITNIDGDTIYYCDANYDDKNTVRYNMSMSKSELKTKISKNLITGDSTGWVAHHENNMIQIPSSLCLCTTDYAGTYRYTVPNACIEIRSGHGTDYEILGFITADDLITVKKANGEWAHVEFQGISGYALMAYLEKIDTTHQTYTVTYSGGIGAIGTAPSQVTVEAGTQISLANNPFVKEGYSFIGWSDGGSHYSEGKLYTVNSSITLTAVWAKIPEMRIYVTHNSKNSVEGLLTKDISIQFKGDNLDGIQTIIFKFDKTKVVPITTVNGTEALGREYTFSEMLEFKEGFDYTDYTNKFVYPNLYDSYFYEFPQNNSWKENDFNSVVSYAEIGDNGYLQLMFKTTENLSCIDFSTGITMRFALLDGTITANNITVATTAEAKLLNSSTSAFISTYTNEAQVLFIYYDDEEASYPLNKPQTIIDTSNDPQTYTVTYTSGEGVTGFAPIQEPVTSGTRITVAESGYIKSGYAFAGWSDGVNIYYAGDTYTVNNDTVFTAVWHLPTLMRVLVSHNSQRFNGLATKDIALQFKGSDISETQSIIISFDKTKVAPITTVKGAESLGEECYLYEAWDAASKDYSGKLAYNSDGEEYFYDLADTVKSGLTVTDKWQSSGVVPVISYAEVGNTGYISIIVNQDKKVTYSDFTSAVTLRFAVLNGSFDDNSIKLATTAQANSLNSSTSATLSAYSGDELITYVYYDSGNNISTLSTPKIEIKGFAISGKVTYDNPKEPIGILLYEGETFVDSVWPGIIDATGTITRDFSLSVDKAGTYTLKVTKADALDYVINNIIVTDTDVDLTKSSSSNISLIRMISCDINGDGYIDTLDITCFVYDMGKAELDARYDHTDMNGDKYRDALDVAILAAGIFTSAPVIEYTP